MAAAALPEVPAPLPPPEVPVPVLAAAPETEPVIAALAAVASSPSEAAVAVVERPAPTAEDLVTDVSTVVELWPAVLRAISESNQVLAVCLADARAVALDGTTLTVALDESESFKCRKADDPANRAALAEAIRSLTGVQPRVRFELRALKQDDLADGLVGPAPPSEDEIVARFKEEFDAEEILDDPDHAPDPQESQT